MFHNFPPKSLVSISVLLILINYSVFSQDLTYEGKAGRVSHSSRDVILEVSPNYIYRSDAFPRISGGFNMQYFITRFMSVNGNFTAGQDYAHFNLGLLGIPLMLLEDIPGYFYSVTGYDSFIFFLFIIGSFENLSFHIPVTGNLDISPYISLLRFQYLYESNDFNVSDFNINYGVGTRMNVYITDKFMISPYVEYNRLYNKNAVWGLHGGIHMGLYIKR